jgi:hypothetical protein
MKLEHVSLFQDRSSMGPRLWSNQVLRTIGPAFTGDVINVSGWDDRDKEQRHYRDYFSKASGYFISNYPGERGMSDSAANTDFGIDLEAPPDPALVGRFDTVFNHTTLEHVFDTFTAFRTLCAMSRDAVIVVVPFAQKMHYSPSWGDYWRFTPQALRRLFERNDMKVVYEVANQGWNSASYLISVGVRRPDEWAGRLPAHQPIASLGDWIGRNPFNRVVRSVTNARRRFGI